MSPRTLTWPGVPGALRYRVLVRDDQGAWVFDEVIAATTCAIPGAVNRVGRSWQVQFQLEPGNGWRVAIPELPLEAPPATPADPERTTLLEWEDHRVPAYRVLIRDHDADGLLLKLPVLGTSYLVDFSTLPPGRTYRWRLQVWDWAEGKWRDLGAYEPLSPPPTASPPPISYERERADTAAPPRTVLLFTIDTEASLQYAADPDPRRAVDDQIFARHQARSAGIEMIMDALDRHDFKGTFFLDILGEYQFGEGSLEPVVAAVTGRGHDLQLHLHSAPHLRFAPQAWVRELAGAMSSYDPEQFRRVLELAITRFVERVGKEPVAYRSGAYVICDSYLQVLGEFGLRIDSSIYAFKNCRVSPWMRARTQPFRIGPLLEVPINWRLEWRATGPVPMQFAPWRRGDDDNRSFTELRPPPTGPPTALVYLGHSYQYLTRGPDLGAEERRRWHRVLERRLSPEHSHRYDRTDPPWFLGEPDQSRIELLKRNLADLAARPDLISVSMGTLAEAYHSSWDGRAEPVDLLPEVIARAGGRRRLTATRIYSADYLRHLEAEGATAAAR